MIKLDLPMTWAIVKCQDVIDVRDGTHDTPSYVENGIPLITSKNLVNGDLDFDNVSHISQEDHIQIGKRSAVDNGDIIMAMIGTIGNPVLVNTTREFSIKNVALFKFRDSRVHAPYFYYLLQSHVIERQFADESRGVTQKFVSLTMLRNLQIPLPPLDEQKRIAAILEEADHARRTRRFTDGVSDTFLQEVFVEMFGDPVTNPMGWEVKMLGKLLATKPRIGTTQPAKSNGKQICVRVGEIGKNRHIDLEECQFVTLDEKQFERYSLEPDDILLARAIGSLDHLGKFSIMQRTSKTVVFDSHVMRLRLNQELMLVNFFAQFLMTHGGRVRFMEQARQTVVQFNINAEQIQAVEIPLPPKELQWDFAEIVQEHEQNRTQQQESARQAEHLFQTLLHQAFRGEL